MASSVAAALKVSWLATGAPGGVPRLASALIWSTPALSVVVPVYVFVPDSTSVPVPALVSVPGPAMMPP